jgi:C1A family cysteine protease
MKIYLFALLSTYTFGLRIVDEFNAWVEQWGKSYATGLEKRYRFSIFSNNYANIQHKNSLGRSHQLAINQFADLTQEEFVSRHLNNYTPHTSKSEYKSYLQTVKSLPGMVDWVGKGAVTPVKNQGLCGSCWSFSTTGAVEGAWFLHSGELVSLSEQQLMDCSSSFGNAGCNGGMMDNAFKYIIQNGGICSEESYSYTAQNGTCTQCTPVAKISGYVDVQPNNETALMYAVAQQPVSVAVEADGFDWQFYSGGIVTDSCGTNLDHGVLVVGYGTDYTSQPQDYWKVKNSWGVQWGEEGYIRLGRGQQFSSNGECGILMNPSYPVV